MEDVEGGGGLSEFLVVLLGLTCLLISSWQADHLESQMRDMLKVQEHMDICLDQRDEELHQLWSQSQSDGAQLAALSLQMQELISLVESRAEVVGKDLEEINGQFDRHRGKINCLKIREKDAKEETEKLKGFIVGAVSQIRILTSKITQVCQDIRDIKLR